MTGRRGRNPLPFVVNSKRFASALTVTRAIAASGWFDAQNSGSLTMSLPAGSPGQMLVAIIGHRAAAAFTLPSGWTAVRQVTNASTATAGPVGFLMAYKVRGASEPTPTFTRTGGNAAVGFVAGYTPSVGSLAYDQVSGITGAATSTITIPTLTPAGTRNLLVVGCASGNFWNVLQIGFSAASLPAGATTGAASPDPAVLVSATDWGNTANVARQNGAVNVGIQGFGLWDVPATATGQMSTAAPFGAYEAAAVSFTWSP